VMKNPPSPYTTKRASPQLSTREHYDNAKRRPPPDPTGVRTEERTPAPLST